MSLIVREGEPSRVRAVALSGDPGLPLARVVEAFGLSPSDVLDLSRVDQGLEGVRNLYRRERFFRARVDVAPERWGQPPMRGTLLLEQPLTPAGEGRPGAAP